MKFQCLTRDDRHRFQAGIVAIEQAAVYPLGNHFFQIDHGQDYFAFFDRLGAVRYYVALDQRESGPIVAAVGAGILRRVPMCAGEPPQLAWYLCDLKVHPRYQGQRLSIRLLRHAVMDGRKQCDRGYAISMNPSHAQPNPLSRVFQRLTPIALSCTATLGIYSLDAIAMLQVEPLLIKHRGQISYLSLQGIKDLRLQSTQQTLPLLHVQWGATANLGTLTPRSGYIHMFCAPLDDALSLELAKQNILPQATASILSYQMAISDWRFVLTSDI